MLHFITRYPGLRVADVLLILNITKQSLARVLSQLVDGGLVVQSTGDTDRRERRLHLTTAGKALMRRLVDAQTRRVVAPLASAATAPKPLCRRFLAAMIEPETRAMVDGAVSIFADPPKDLNGESRP